MLYGATDLGVFTFLQAAQLAVGEGMDLCMRAAFDALNLGGVQPSDLEQQTAREGCAADAESAYMYAGGDPALLGRSKLAAAQRAQQQGKPISVSW